MTPDGITIGLPERAAKAAPSPAQRAVALTGADVLAFVLSWAAALGVARWLDEGAAGPAGAALAVQGGLFAMVLSNWAARGHHGHRLPGTAEAREVAVAGLAALLGSGFLSYMLRIDAGHGMLLALWGVFVPATLLLRHIARAVLDRVGAPRQQVVVVGHGEAATQAMRLLLDGAVRGWAVAGVLHPQRIGPMEHGRWTGVLRQHQADLVVLAMDEPPRDLTEWLVRDRVPFAIVQRPLGLPVLGGTPTRVMSHDAVLWTYRDNLRRPVARAGKLAIDIAGAATLLVLLLPVLLLIAAAVRMDGGPVLYGHKRIGARGRMFSCLKFRSMVPDADAVLHRLLSTDPAAAAEWAATRKLRRDPRVTRTGLMLRRTSLDELPQLFNVLRGDMSLVGPRPIVTAEIPRYGADIHHYYAARPGLTGLWQVSGRSDTGYGQRVRLDTWYAKNWSLWTDLVILARTVPAVLKRQGAV